jgi:hypothetical protein
MAWFRKNPFLGVLAAITAIAVLATGLFLFNALGRYQAEAMTYEEQTLALQRLQESKPFPSAENVDRTRAEFGQAQSILDGIGRGLQLEVPKVTAQQFQDQLREKVNDIVSRAAAQGVELGEDFYLGFESYETQPPPAAAAGPLALQLQSVHAVVSLLVDTKVHQIAGIVRQPLAAEDPGAKEDNEDRDSGRKPAAAPSEGELPELVLAPFDVRFTADPAAFRLAFNRILETTPPVFVRLVGVTNSAPAAPPKAAEGEEAGAATDTIKPVLGQELAVVDLRLASVETGKMSVK